MRGGERIERFLDLRGDPGLVETLGPVNLKAHHGPTIEHGNLRAFGNAVMHGRHLVQANLSPACQHDGKRIKFGRSEEHTSELQSLMRISYAVFCLKKKTKQNTTTIIEPT